MSKPTDAVPSQAPGHDAAEARLSPVWSDAVEARLTAGVSERMLDLAALAPGERVLDLASGTGEPVLRAARRVGPAGRVLGVDLLDSALEVARTAAAREGLRQLELRTGDATTLEVEEGAFEVVTCRWGLMYMSDPERALAHARRALVPGGRLVVATWAEPERVPYATLPRRVTARYTDVPPEPADGPSVFRHADAARFEALLSRVGFRVTHTEEIDVPVIEVRDGAELVRWLRNRRGALVRLVERLPAAAQRAWEEELAREAERYRVGPHVLLGGVTRLVRAER